MRQSIRQFVEICAATLPFQEPIYEFGSFQVPGQEHIADLRTLFPGKQFTGTDMREGTGVDLVLNLHDIDLPDASVGSAISLDTLEHVEYPHRAVEELHRVLALGGVLVITSVMRFPIHDYPYDYWRFTPEAFRSLLKPFEFSFVDHAGEDDFPHTIVGVGMKAKMSEATMSSFLPRFKEWKSWARLNSWPEWADSPPEELLQESGWKRTLKRITPPALVDVARKVKPR